MFKLPFRSELESSGALHSAVNPSGQFRPVTSLLIDLAAKHVELSKVASKEAEMAFEETEAEEDAMEKLRIALGQVGNQKQIHFNSFEWR